MALPAQGSPISFADLRTMFGGSGAVSLNSLYAGGGKVQARAQGKPNNTRTNIPTSGTISINNFCSAQHIPTTTFEYTATGMGWTYPTSTTSFTSDIGGNGFGINELHIVAWGGGGAGAQWPNYAPGGNGGGGLRISFYRGYAWWMDDLLDTFSSFYGSVGDQGSYQMGRLPDVRRAGGPGGTTTVYGGSTMIATVRGGNGSQGYWPNNDSTSYTPYHAGVVGDDGAGWGGNATYGGGGGGSPGTAAGTSVYGGNGGHPGYTPAGGGTGVDNGWDQNVVGGQGRVRIYVNTGAPF